jgi:CO/xanthine dehydrogenase FAD-binding subunit
MPLTVRTVATAAEAARLLAADRAARFLGGGTLVMRAVNEGDISFTTIVRATDPSLRRIEAAAGRIVLGAAATMADILADRALDFLHPAARAVGGPAVRGMATVGGNLFAPCPYGDFTTALLALDATVAAEGRETDIASFLRDRDRQPRPLVTAVAFPRPPSGAFRFAKVTRVKPKGLSVLSIAALLPWQGGRLGGCRIAFGAMGPTPLRARAAEQALEGRSLDPAGVAQALAAAAEGLDPPTDAIASAWWRREIAPVHLRRLLLGA